MPRIQGSQKVWNRTWGDSIPAALKELTSTGDRLWFLTVTMGENYRANTTHEQVTVSGSRVTLPKVGGLMGGIPSTIPIEAIFDVSFDFNSNTVTMQVDLDLLT